MNFSIFYVRFCTLFCLVEAKLTCYPSFCYSLKTSSLAENVGKIISAHPRISAHSLYRGHGLFYSSGGIFGAVKE